MPEIEAIANYRCKTGENPLWDERRGIVLWLDIPTGRLFRYDQTADRHECFYEGASPVGGMTMQEDGSLLLFEANQVSRLDGEGERAVLIRDIDGDMQRFNDVIADPEGRVFAGTIGKDKQRGGLYRVDLDGRVTRLFQGTGCANGMGFSPDLRTFYWTCSTTRRVFRFDYERAAGALSGRKVWKAAEPDEGIPDGLTVDAEGCIWNAWWDGYALKRFTAEGELLSEIRFPVAKVSSVIFGGPELTDLYVTTAGGSGSGSGDGEGPEGTLYRVRGAGARGRGEFRSRVVV